MKKILLLIFVAFAVSACFSNDKESKRDDDIFDGEYVDCDFDSSPDAADEDGDFFETEQRPADEDEISDEDLIPPISSVIIATYNTMKFFDVICDSGDCDSRSSYEKVPSETQYREKVEDLAVALNKINADIILLQEVEKDSCLKDLFNEMNGKYDEYYLGEKGWDASVDTGVITRGKITYKNNHTESIDYVDNSGETTFTRAFLEVHITLQGREIIVFSAHFKAKTNDDSKRRLAEANAAVRILNRVAAENPKALIVLGGDLNDSPGGAAIKLLEDSETLLRVASELPSADQATYYYNNQAIAIDHLFHAIKAGGSYVSGTAEVIKDAENWYALSPSDHASLRAEFEF